MRAAGGGGEIFACGAFEVLEPAFTLMPDPQTVHEALRAPDRNKWTAAMNE